MSKEVTSLHELYVDSLRDLYSAETQLVEALPKVAKAAGSKELKNAVQTHLEQTKEQVMRLEEIFTALDEKPTGHTCVAMKGLIKEADELMEMVKDKKVLDAALIGAAQKVEHYEIAGYGTARTFAQLMGHNDQADILQQTLDEEGETDKLLTQLAESMVNERANETNPPEMRGEGALAGSNQRRS